MENQNEVDVNVLVKLYNSKLATLTNQNVLLEAKLATLTQDYKSHIEALIEENADLKQQLEEKAE
jgi:benzoyl-CoA reductase/2-hydroxyglutaryl-CoA dehydratase subunit BcrC/BadD/HgdB